MQVSASTIHQHFRPSRCDLRSFLIGRGEKQAPPGPYEDVLFRLGKKHEADHLATLGEYADLRTGDLAERAERTLEMIGLGERVLYQPVFVQKTKMADTDVEIVGVPDFLVRQGSDYTIQDTKLSLHADEKSHPEILRQLELYAWLFEKSVGRVPAALEAVLGDSSIVQVPYDGGQVALGLLEHIVRTARSASAPYAPVGWSKCQACGYRDRCWATANKAQDVAIVYGVDQGLAVAMREDGVRTVRQLVQDFTVDSLADFTRPWGDRQRRVGKQAETVLNQARAMHEGREILLSPPALPDGDNFVMFDLEGLPPQFDELDKVYLWGTQVFGSQPSEYQAAVADFGPDGDRQVWQDFLSQAQAIFDAYGDIPFVHWHQYEKVKLKAYIDRYGDVGGVAQRVIDNLLDLLPVTRDAIVLPEPSYSLKVVERRVGYKRKLAEYGGDWSMAQYIEAVETNDASRRKEIMQQILDYNREDLEATWAVFQWLRGLRRKNKKTGRPSER